MHTRSLFTLTMALIARIAASTAGTAPLPLVSPMFGDNMVLQRGKPNPIWGWSNPGQVVRVETAGQDRHAIQVNGLDLSFVTVAVTDQSGWPAPRAADRIHFDIEGPGEIVATDNGDPTSFELFQSHDRNAFNGLCLVIIRGKSGQPGRIQLRAASIKTRLERNGTSL
jgi:hypothetical protein